MKKFLVLWLIFLPYLLFSSIVPNYPYETFYKVSSSNSGYGWEFTENNIIKATNFALYNNKYLLLATGNYEYGNLLIVDISNSNNLNIISHIELGNIKDIYVSGKYAYIIDGYTNGGLNIIDLSDIKNPKKISRLEISSGLTSIYVSGNFAYITKYSPDYKNPNGIFYIVNISDPKNPKLENSFELSGKINYYGRLVISGNFAYILIENKLQILNISDPSNIISVEEFKFESNPIYIVLKNNYLYITCAGKSGYDEMYILDISNPTTPKKVWYSKSSSPRKGMFITGKFLYVANGEKGILIYDISNPIKPIQKYKISLSPISNYNSYGESNSYPYYAEKLTVSNEYCYVLNEMNGELRIIHLVDKTPPIFLYSLINLEEGKDSIKIKIKDTSPIEKFEIIGGSDKDKFSINGSTIKFKNTPKYENPQDSNKDNIYEVKIKVIDKAGNSSQKLIKIKILPKNKFVAPKYPYIYSYNLKIKDIKDIVVIGEYAYLIGKKLYIVNVKEPENIKIIKSLNISGNDIRFINGFLLVRNYGSWKIIDISYPENPKLAYSFSCYDIFIDEIYAYLACGDKGVEVYNVSNPYSPQKIASFKIYDKYSNNYVYHVFVEKTPFLNDSKILYAFTNGAVIKYDISNIYNPKKIENSSYYEGVGSQDKWYIYTNNNGEFYGYYKIYTLFYNYYNESNYDYYKNIGIISLGYSSYNNYIKTPGHPLDLFISGNYGYIADGEKGLYIIDMTKIKSWDYNSTNFYPIYHVDIPGITSGVYVYGKYAYVVNGNLYVIKLVDEESPIIKSNEDIELTENILKVLKVEVEDPSKPFSFQIVGGDDAKKFEIDNNSGILKFIKAPDFETPEDFNKDNIYEVKIKVMDAAGNSSEKLFKIKIVDTFTYLWGGDDRFFIEGINDNITLYIKGIKGENYLIDNFTTDLITGKDNKITIDKNSFGDGIVIYRYKDLPESYYVQNVDLISDNGTPISFEAIDEDNAQVIELDKVYKDSFGLEYIDNREQSHWIKINIPISLTGLYSLIIYPNFNKAKILDNSSLIISVFNSKLSYLGSYEVKLNKNNKQNISKTLLYLPKGDYYFSINPKNIKFLEYYFKISPEIEVFSFYSDKIENNKIKLDFAIPRKGKYSIVINGGNFIEKFEIYRDKIINDKHKIYEFNPNEFFANKSLYINSGFYSLKIKLIEKSSLKVTIFRIFDDYEWENNNNFLNSNIITNNFMSGELSKNDKEDFFMFSVKQGALTFNLNFDEDNNHEIDLYLYNYNGKVLKGIPFYESGKWDFQLNGGNYYISLKIPEGFEKINYKFELSGDIEIPEDYEKTNLPLISPFFDDILHNRVTIYLGNDEIETTSPGNLIIITGNSDDKSDPLYEAFQLLSEKAYYVFKRRGFSDDDIYYFNINLYHDIDNDGVLDPVVDSDNVTEENIINVIENWAVTKKSNKPLFIYLVGHGGIYTFKLQNGKILIKDSLKKAIDYFIEKTDRKVVVIIEACHSNSFNIADEINNVVFVSSADKKELAFIQPIAGISFSYYLLQNLLAGYSIKDAFYEAKEKFKNIIPENIKQTPIIETNDSDLAKQKVGGNFAFASMETISIDSWYGKDENIKDLSENNKLELFITPSSKCNIYNIQKVWALIVPWYIKLKDKNFFTPDFSGYVVEMKFNKQKNKFTGVFDNLIYNGKYSIIYNIQDIDGNINSFKSEIECINGKDYNILLNDENIINLKYSWNLKSIPVDKVINIEEIFNNTSIITIWKWNYKSWEIWSPIKSIRSLIETYGMSLIKELKSGEGFWINCKKNIKFSLGVGNEYGLEKLQVKSGWNLVGIGKDINIDELNQIENIKTVWKWTGKNWEIWSPDSNLIKLIKNYGINDFNKLTKGEGFWVYKK